MRAGSADAFLYGAVFMANSASLLLPGSNLTNLIVLSHEHVTGAEFAARLAPAWAVAVPITIVFVAVALLRGDHESAHPYERAPFRPRLGTVGVLAATVLVLALAQPAVDVLVLGIVVAIVTRPSPRAANPLLLVGVLAVAVLLGWAARGAHAEHLLAHAGRWETAWVAAGLALLVNNLPAAVVLSAHAPPHARALLLGLDLGPNFAVTGSLSAIFWLQVARASGAQPSIRRYAKLGAVLMPLTLVAALLVTGRA